jgi:thioredoxin reductase (NADPH)
MVERLIILGSGPAGLSAAIYASREGFEPLVIGGFAPGGQLQLTTKVENYPGFPEGVDGPVLIDQMMKQAEKFGTRFVYENATGVDFGRRPFMIKTAEKEYESECVIIATGANAKWLGIESEKRFVGRGVSVCGTCDAAFYKGKDVIVVGGGDTAMEDSTFITRFANSVTIVHRKDSFRASKPMQDRVLANPKIKVIWNSAVEEITGGKTVTGVKIRNVLTKRVTDMRIDGVFIAIGYAPNTDIFKGKLNLDQNGYIIPKDEVYTGIDGVFVAGDVADHFYRQAATAAASGVKAALVAREYLQSLESAGKKQ